MGEVRRKSRDIIRPTRQLLRHVEKAMRQLRKLARSVMGERLKCIPVARRSARPCPRNSDTAEQPGQAESEPEVQIAETEQAIGIVQIELAKAPGGVAVRGE